MAACADAGLLVLTCGSQHEVVRLIPPLDVSAAEIAEAVEIFGETLNRLGEPVPRRDGRRIFEQTASARSPMGRALGVRGTGDGGRANRPRGDQRFWARNFITSSSRKRRSPRLQTR